MKPSLERTVSPSSVSIHRWAWDAGSIRARAAAFLLALSGSAAFSYATIVLLQVKVIWQMWQVRDLTYGDTSSYFTSAFRWFANGAAPINWSPLYTLYYSLFLHLSADAFWATTAHRLVIVLVLAVLVLAVMRALLPGPPAWLVAAWWTLLPIDFNSLYEVHLFAVLPPLVAALVIHHRRGRWGRGIALAVLAASAVIVRNELLIPAALVALCALTWEVRLLRRERRGPEPSGASLAPYGVCAAAALALVLIFAARASDATAFAQVLESKHTLNLCQIYAFGYQQRHTDWNGSPWEDCRELMVRDFGTPRPSLSEAFARNPAAVREHVWWNVTLIPNGIEVLLFNACFGQANPDYAPVRSGSLPALLLALAALAIIVAGARAVLADRRVWWEEWIRPRAWLWLVLLAVSAGVVIVIVIERPRPSYMFVLGLTLRALIGTALVALFARRWDWSRLASMFPIVVLGALVITLPYFRPEREGPRSLLEAYTRMTPFAPLMHGPQNAFVGPGYGLELCSYLGGADPCTGVSYWKMRKDDPGRPVSAALDQRGATVLLVDGPVAADPPMAAFLDRASQLGWQTIAKHDWPHERWTLLVRAARAAPGGLHAALAGGFYPHESYGGAEFSWARDDATLVVPPHARGQRLFLDVEPGPSVAALPLRIEVRGAGSVRTISLAGRRTVALELPQARSIPVTLALHALTGTPKPVPGDPRTLTFRVFDARVR